MLRVGKFVRSLLVFENPYKYVVKVWNQDGFDEERVQLSLNLVLFRCLEVVHEKASIFLKFIMKVISLIQHSHLINCFLQLLEL